MKLGLSTPPQFSSRATIADTMLDVAPIVRLHQIIYIIRVHPLLDLAFVPLRFCVLSLLIFSVRHSRSKSSWPEAIFCAIRPRGNIQVPAHSRLGGTGAVLFPDHVCPDGQLFSRWLRANLGRKLK